MLNLTVPNASVRSAKPSNFATFQLYYILTMIIPTSGSLFQFFNFEIFQSSNLLIQTQSLGTGGFTGASKLLAPCTFTFLR